MTLHEGMHGIPPERTRLAPARGLAVIVAAAAYGVGRVHSPDYTMGLFGRSGLAATVVLRGLQLP